MIPAIFGRQFQRDDLYRPWRRAGTRALQSAGRGMDVVIGVDVEYHGDFQGFRTWRVFADEPHDLDRSVGTAQFRARGVGYYAGDFLFVKKGRFKPTEAREMVQKGGARCALPQIRVTGEGKKWRSGNRRHFFVIYDSTTGSLPVIERRLRSDPFDLYKIRYVSGRYPLHSESVSSTAYGQSVRSLLQNQ